MALRAANVDEAFAAIGYVVFCMTPISGNKIIKLAKL